MQAMELLVYTLGIMICIILEQPILLIIAIFIKHNIAVIHYQSQLNFNVVLAQRMQNEMAPNESFKSYVFY